jgi:hypothetical protein
MLVGVAAPSSSDPEGVERRREKMEIQMISNPEMGGRRGGTFIALIFYVPNCSSHTRVVTRTEYTDQKYAIPAVRYHCKWWDIIPHNWLGHKSRRRVGIRIRRSR